MIDYAKLPTDNLYKLLAISGLLIAAVSVAWPMHLINDLEVQAIELNKDLKTLEFQTDLLDRQVSRHQNASKQEEIGPHWDALKQQKLRAFELEATIEKLDTVVRQTRMVRWACYIGAPTGLLAAIAGFSLWYSKGLRHQDRLLQYQIQKAELEMKAATPAS
jgi:hypothetical protein